MPLTNWRSVASRKRRGRVVSLSESTASGSENEPMTTVQGKPGRRGGLGRGLGALIPTTSTPSSGAALDAIIGGDQERERPAPVPGASFEQVPVGAIVPN